jgi:hypothetical protein
MTDPERLPPDCFAILEYLADHWGIQDLRDSGLPVPRDEDLLELHRRGLLELITKDPLARITEAGEDLVLGFRKRQHDKKVRPDVAATQEFPPPAARFQSKGDSWEVAFAGKTAFVNDSKGLRYVARLLADPNPVKPVGALTLCGREEDLAQVEQTSQPILDKKAKGEYEARLKKLKDDIEEARGLGNQETEIDLERQKDALVGQLRSAVGMHGKGRELGSRSPVRRATDAVRKALDRAYAQLNERGLSELADHLRQAIRREGNAFAYRPDPPAPVWEV